MTRLPTSHVALFLHLGPCEQSLQAYSAAQASLTDSASVFTYFWSTSVNDICLMPIFGLKQRSDNEESPGMKLWECSAIMTIRFLVIGFGALAM